MKRSMIVATAAAALALGGVGLLHADDAAKGPDVPSPSTQPCSLLASATTQPSDEESGVRMYAMAQDLATWGRDNQNPAALALAAKIMSSVSTEKMPNRAKTTGSSGGAGGGGALGAAAQRLTKPLNAQALLAEARAMAGNDPKAQAAVDAINVGRTTSRGAIGGPKTGEDQVLAHQFDQYDIVFKGGEPAEVGVFGDGRTPLGLAVVGMHDDVIASDEGVNCRVSFVPDRTMRVKIMVINRYNRPNSYTIMTN